MVFLLHAQQQIRAACGLGDSEQFPRHALTVPRFHASELGCWRFLSTVRGAAIAEFHGFPHSSRACLPATKWPRRMPYFGSAARYAVGDSPRTRWKVRLKWVSDWKPTS